MSRLEDNLREEQRAVSEQEYVTFKTLLTPLQVGVENTCRPADGLPASARPTEKQQSAKDKL